MDGDVSKMGNPVTLIPDYEKTSAIEFFSQKNPFVFQKAIVILKKIQKMQLIGGIDSHQETK